MNRAAHLNLDPRERPPAGEPAAILTMIATLKQQIATRYRGATALRDAHPKHHGLVDATFELDAARPSDLREGIFAGTRYDAVIRFSNSHPLVNHDLVRDVRGMAIKLTKTGIRSLTGEAEHDFVLTTGPEFFAKDAVEFVDFPPIADKPLGLFLYFFWPKIKIAALKALRKGRTIPTSPLTLEYFGQTPYKHGPHYVKYCVKPAPSNGDFIPLWFRLFKIPLRLVVSLLPRRFALRFFCADILSRIMARQIERGGATFDFYIQKYPTDAPPTSAIEDALEPWPKDVQFKKVGTITIRTGQDVTSAPSRAQAEAKSFNPWRALEVNRPLGSINRARREIYREMAAFRTMLNKRRTDASNELGVKIQAMIQQESAAQQETDLGIALSGGGHRAALFSLGALLYLADVGILGRLKSIASVSGSSLVNAYLALTRPGLSEQSDVEFEAHVAHIASRFAGNRTWLWPSWTGIGLLFVLAVALTVRPIGPIGTAFVLIALAGILLLARFAGPRSGGSLWAWRGTWVWLATSLTSVVLAIIGWRAAGAVTWDFLLPAAVWRVALRMACVTFPAWVYYLRGFVMGLSIKHTVLRQLPGRPRTPLLGNMNASIDHVICATEMHAGTHTYFGRDFVYSRGLGYGEPATLPVHTAVRASASFPLVFPLCSLKTRPHSFRLPDPEVTRRKGDTDGGVTVRPQRVWVLSDGGVSDNLADAWQLESEDRINRMIRLAMEHPNQVNDELVTWIGRLTRLAKRPLIVVDGATSFWWQTMSDSWIPLWTEILGAYKAAMIAYQTTTTTRDRDLRARFTANRPAGAVIAIRENPKQVCQQVLSSAVSTEEQKRRADAARNHLQLFFDDSVVRLSDRSVRIGTYLTAVGASNVAHLLRHGYLQAMITLHVWLDYPLVDGPDLPNFEGLSRGSTTGRTSRPHVPAPQTPSLQPTVPTP